NDYFFGGQASLRAEVMLSRQSSTLRPPRETSPDACCGTNGVLAAFGRSLLLGSSCSRAADNWHADQPHGLELAIMPALVSGRFPFARWMLRALGWQCLAGERGWPGWMTGSGCDFAAWRARRRPIVRRRR